MIKLYPDSEIEIKFEEKKSNLEDLTKSPAKRTAKKAGF